MKKLLSICLTIAIIAGMACLTGCNNKIQATYEDQQFLDGLAKGLEARWDYTDQYPEGLSSVEDIQKAIQLELDEVGEFETAVFNDQTLRANALDYINVLHESYEHADYALSDDNYDLWQDYEKQRRKLLQLFIRDNKLTLNSRHQDNLKEYVKRGETTTSQEAKVTALINMLSTVEYVEQVKSDKEQAIDRAHGRDNGPRKYTAKLTNTTDYTILKLTLDLRLVDKNGKVIENHGVSFKNLKPGDSATIELETAKSFATIQNGINSFVMRR